MIKRKIFDSTLIASWLLLRGLQDGLNVKYVQEIFSNSPNSKEIRKLTLNCLILNLVIFLGSLVLFEFYVNPLVSYLLNVNTGSETLLLVGRISDAFFSVITNLFWFWPIHFLSFFLNGIWYQDIAAAVYKPSKEVSQSSFRQFLRHLASIVYRYGIQYSFLTQATVIYYVPIFGIPASVIGFSWLYSLCCFEYKWVMLGWTLERRITYFQRHWVYFIGFGN